MWVFKTLHTSHVVIISSHVYRNQAILNYYNEAQPPLVVVKHPWSDPVNRAFYTGVPPYTCLLQDLAFIKNQQVLLLESFVNKVKEALIECGVTGTRMTEERLQNLFDQFRNELTQHLSGIRPIGQSATVHVHEVEREETGRGYTLDVYGGRLHRVPQDWRSPRCGVFSLWRQWWIGDTVRQIPPLRFLQTKDIENINDIGLSTEEMHHRTGSLREPRRKASKYLSDMSYVMDVITNTYLRCKPMPLVITYSTIDAMFKEVVPVLVVNIRDDQKQWLTVVRQLRREKIGRNGLPVPVGQTQNNNDEEIDG
jgi:hypothetical protein